MFKFNYFITPNNLLTLNYPIYKQICVVCMKFETKMDALDFVINILIEHEKKLDMLIERLEETTRELEYIKKREKDESLERLTKEALTEIISKKINL